MNITELLHQELLEQHVDASQELKMKKTQSERIKAQGKVDAITLIGDFIASKNEELEETYIEGFLLVLKTLSNILNQH